MKVFPVEASAHPQFADAFGSHRGTDIFAAVGSVLVAVVDGVARTDTDPKGGNVVYLRSDDGTVYYYAHLSSYFGADNFPRRVSAGDALGFVGTSGNAQGKTPHLHFEVHPNGGDAVDPFPLLKAVASTLPGATPPATEASGGGGLLLGLLLLLGRRWRRR